jgi:hypothetical protein
MLRTMRSLPIVAIGLWMWTQNADARTTEPYCGDAWCNTDQCPMSGEGTPGNGCEEDLGNCPQDCGYCGDETCAPAIGENEDTCPQDCGTCGDGICQGQFENPSNCADCPLCPGQDGNECTWGGNECETGQVCTICHYCAWPQGPQTNQGGPYCPSECYHSYDCDSCDFAEPICYSPGSSCFVGGIPEEGRCVDLSTATVGNPQGSELTCPVM